MKTGKPLLRKHATFIEANNEEQEIEPLRAQTDQTTHLFQKARRRATRKEERCQVLKEISPGQHSKNPNQAVKPWHPIAEAQETTSGAKPLRGVA